MKLASGVSQELSMLIQPQHDSKSSTASSDPLPDSSGVEKGEEDGAPDLGPLIHEPQRERPLWRRVLLLVIAVLAFALGVVGWLVPVITGIPFYVLGMVCLAKVSPWMAERVNALDERLPLGARRALRWRPRWAQPVP